MFVPKHSATSCLGTGSQEMNPCFNSTAWKGTVSRFHIHRTAHPLCFPSWKKHHPTHPHTLLSTPAMKWAPKWYVMTLDAIVQYCTHVLGKNHERYTAYCIRVTFYNTKKVWQHMTTITTYVYCRYDMWLYVNDCECISTPAPQLQRPGWS